MQDISTYFISIGGQFISDVNEISQKLSNIKAFVFDWDGVFNNGQKDADGSSNFSEVDSMGTNLLRFSYYLKNKQLPVSAIISGETNKTAFYFAKRECFNYSFYKVADKIQALNLICGEQNIQHSQVAYFFDDVLDFSIAEVCGLRIFLAREANPLLNNFCVENSLADYMTGNNGGNYGIREATELLMGLYGNFNEAVVHRKNYSEEYKNYIIERRKILPEFFTMKDGKILPGDKNL
jgi:3-deoxy-D-manno-octulosonate 8-phosphate phosphatase (KDO 8-P phosphatase)